MSHRFPPFRFAALSLATTLAGPIPALAGSSEVEHVLVTVPIHRTAAETALPVTVLGGDALRDRVAGTLGGTLAGQPGLSSASFGPGVGQPAIRGHSGPRVRILHNGLGNADASTASADHAVTVEPLLAESVEILRGPATLLYGGGAIGGVINVIDNRIPRLPAAPGTSAAAELRHDSATDGDTGVLRLDGGTADWAWGVSGVYRDWNDMEVPGLAFDREVVEDLDESGRGHVDNSAGRNHTITGGGSRLFEHGYVGLAVSDTRQRYGIPSGGHAHAEADHDHHDDHEDEAHEEHEEHEHNGSGADLHHGDVVIDMAQTRYDLGAEREFHQGALDTLRGQLSYTDYEHDEVSQGEVLTTFTNRTWEGRIEAVHAGVFGWHGVGGLQLKRSDVSARGAEAFVPAADVRATGVFIVEDLHTGNVTYEIGARFDRDRIDPEGQRARSFDSLSGSAAVLWRFTPDWQAGLALSASERAPGVEELYANAGRAERHDDHFHFHDPVEHAATHAIEVGNTELRQEVSRNADLTLRYAQGSTRGTVSLFYNDFRDYIYLADTGTQVDDVDVLEYQQHDARFHGLEAELTLPIVTWGDGDLELNLYGDVVRGRLDQGGDVPRLPPYRIGTRWQVSHGGLRGYADLLVAADQDRPGRNASATDGYHRLDVGISREWMSSGAATTVFLHGRNLTNEEIRSSTSLLRDYSPESGRSVEVGLRVAF